MPEGFPCSIFDYNDAVIGAAVPLMKAYKRRNIGMEQYALFIPEKFDRDNPWFVRLWGEIEPGKVGGQIGVAVTMSGEPMVELLAFVGPTLEGYPLLMSKSQFVSQYEID